MDCTIDTKAFVLAKHGVWIEVFEVSSCWKAAPAKEVALSIFIFCAALGLLGQVWIWQIVHMCWWFSGFLYFMNKFAQICVKLNSCMWNSLSPSFAVCPSDWWLWTVRKSVLRDNYCMIYGLFVWSTMCIYSAYFIHFTLAVAYPPPKEKLCSGDPFQKRLALNQIQKKNWDD